MKNSYPVTGTLISASAGTGKTYQLALRFVALLCLGVDPTSIVALTFTRKAAGEFRDRILSRLAEGASSPEGAVNLANAVLDLWRGKNGIPALLPEGKNIDDMIAGTPMKRAANRQHFFCQLLKEMVGCFSRLQLCTMDSFFTKLVNLHATELGIGAPGIITEGAEREARELAIRDLCRRIETGDDDSIRDFWEDYDTAVSSTKTDTVAELRELIAKYHGIYLQNKDDEPWKQPLPDIPENEIRPLHPKEINSVEEKIAALCADKEMRLGLKMDQIRNITMKVRNADFSSREKIMEAINARANQDQPLAQMARELFHRERLDSLYHVRRGTCAVFALMKRFEECYEREVRSRGLFSNDDYTRKAMQLINRNEAANDLTFRLDGEIKHWMLDEFQDTSRMQWMTLKPLLENNVANCGDVDRSIFIVGDDKQSIYGWRNATPEIFQSLQTDNSELGQHLRKAQLTVNRRSVQEVLDF
ncbi:MAG: UvrD-helicase domain-containing protein, partial [Akkermansia sp.]